MKITSLHTGLHLTLDNVSHKIIRITENNICYLEKTSDLAIQTYPKQNLIELWAEGRIVFKGKEQSLKEINHIYSQQGIKLLSEPEQKQALKRYEYVKAVDKKFSTPRAAGIEPIILEVALAINDDMPPSNITLYRWWKRWYNTNKDLRSLANMPLGRTDYRKYKKEVLASFDTIIEEVYLTREQQSKQATYDALCYQIQLHNEQNINQIHRPSRATFYRMLKELDAYTVMVERHGKRTAEKVFRVSGAGVITKNILERVEIDHTPMNVVVIDEKTGVALGRPNLSVALDKYSRMPLGIEVGFEDPSELSVMRVLRNAIWPKKALLSEYPDIENEWPAYGIPSVLVCDNGLEFHSKQLRRVCAELNIELVFCPKKEPNYKGAVERFLGTFNRQTAHRLKGSTFSNINQRGDYNSEEEACVTLQELKELIYLWITDIYNQSFHKTLGISPYQKWQEGYLSIEPRLPESKESLDLLLSKECLRTIGHQGIQFENLFYNSQILRTLRVLHGSRYEATIRVNMEDLGYVWIYDQKSDSFMEIPCINQEYAQGLTLFQHRAICRLRRENNKKDHCPDTLLASKEKLRQRIKKIGEEKGLRKRKKVARIGQLPTGQSSKDINPVNRKSSFDQLKFTSIPDLKVNTQGGEE